MTAIKEAQKPRIPAPDLSEYRNLNPLEISALLARASELVQKTHALEADCKEFERRIGGEPSRWGLSQFAGGAREGADWLEMGLAEMLIKQTGSAVATPGDDEWPYAEEES